MNYEMGGTILSKTVKDKDLGVTMNANMKVSEQCRIAASKGNQVLGMIRRNITYKEKNLIIPEERLKECGLTTLETTRRLRGDKIEVFKILNGYENIDSNIFFSKLWKVK